ncbi:DNA-binding response regulator [Planobispora siamensis]|uniref:Sensory transduction protein RegX3 n=1 Tax=Planobispora siamensis TaxID=936338 RepID=A0A8J3SJL8_9ACTN|nr:DNA-binding response regulator [Planobispora siamensis]
MARGLVTVLAQAGFEVHRVATAAEAVRAAPSDVVLVDLNLPDGDGIDVIRRLRDRPETAVIAVTARSEEHERVLGLRVGADDYIVKPFGVSELLARIDAVLRRTRAARAVSHPDEPLVLGPMRIGVGTREVTVGGDPVTLTRKEFELLLLLARRAPDVVSRDVILDQIWGATWEPSSRTLDTHIAALRQKIGPAVLIRTIHGVGYRLLADQPELIG